MDRCRNPRNPSYPDYGERGIDVCEYYHDFQNWYADVLDPWPGLTLDRIDNDGNYEPGNLRWADRLVQRMNQRPRSKTKAKQNRPPPLPDPEDAPW